MTRFEAMTVRGLDPGDALLPGHYTVREGAHVERRPIEAWCPYCEGPLVELVTDGALRVVTAKHAPRAGQQRIEGVPAPLGAVLLKCDPCDQVFTSRREVQS